MRSFLKEIEDKFLDLEESCDKCDTPKSQCTCDDEIDEQNVTGAIAGYNIPAAFAKPGNWKQKNARYESKTHNLGQYQVPEFDKEVQGTAHKKDLDMANRKTKLQVEDVLENKYQQLIESYRNFSVADPKISPERKVKNTIQEIAKKLQEIETMVNYNTRLKTESGVTSSNYGPGTQKALTKISERLIKISERVRSLGE